MPILEWKDEYSVGVEKIDNEHKRLVEMINTAHQSVDTLADVKAVKALRAEMKRYATTHFATEEMLMKEHDYPDADRHVAEHKRFLEQVKAADVNFAADRIVPGTIKILSFLADWLVKHILQTDMQLGTYLKEKGVK
ncbi:bacteriohemerythrin [Pseudodesulfovibrio sp.]|nr:bacteriohemerythrin [Pseudodesulfovibrio sp.]